MAVVTALIRLRVFAIHLVRIFARDETITDFLNFSPRIRAIAVGN